MSAIAAPDSTHLLMDFHDNDAGNGWEHGPPRHGEAPQYARMPLMEHNVYLLLPPPPVSAQPPGYGPAGSTGFTAQRRKQMRVREACEQCRRKKQKCDAGNSCSFCKESDLRCQYRDTLAPKPNKNADKAIPVLDKVTRILEETLQRNQNFASRLDSFGNGLARLEQQLIERTAAARSGPSELAEPRPERKQRPDDHRTAPHNLILLWPSVRRLLQQAHVDVNDGYVVEAENRGILRLYGRGEGIDDQDGTQPGSPASPAHREDGFSHVPSPPEGIWGGGLHTYALPNAELRSHSHTAGGLKSDGTLDLDAGTIWHLWDSYLEQMHVIHPFLEKSRTRKRINNFILRYCQPRGHRMQLKRPFAVCNSEFDRHYKRQWSNGPEGSTGTGGDIMTKPYVQTERSPGNAIIYLVLALGKRSPQLDYGSQRLSAAGSSTSTTPNNMDVIPGIAYYAKAAEILGEQGDGNDLIHAQMFLLAGLYKGQLARVKESMSWITIAGRAIQSLLDRYKLYNENYDIVYGDLRSRFDESKKKITDMRENLIVLASWTCLQLESDILAELPLPSSGIQNIENLLLLPRNMAENEQYIAHEALPANGEFRGESHSNVIIFYNAQTILRQQLNQVHRQLYGPGSLNPSHSEVQTMLHGHEMILSKWTSTLPPNLKWVDNDPPPPGILSARLRAKYWEVRYTVNGTFLDYALHIMPHVKAGRSVKEAARDIHRKPRDKAEIHLFEAIERMGETEVSAACQRCIDAVMESAVALDGVLGRLIVTNIHSTAHA
jgi:hypothetical protein